MASQTMRAQGKSLGRVTPVPVVVRSIETPDQYETDFRRRIHPHTDVMKQRSQQINFALQRVWEITGGSVPPVTPHCATSSSPFETREEASAGAPFIATDQAGHINTEGIDRFPGAETLRVTSSLDEDLRPLPYGAVGKQPSNKEALIPTCIHKNRRHPI